MLAIVALQLRIYGSRQSLVQRRCPSPPRNGLRSRPGQGWLFCVESVSRLSAGPTAPCPTVCLLPGWGTRRVASSDLGEAVAVGRPTLGTEGRTIPVRWSSWYQDRA